MKLSKADIDKLKLILEMCSIGGIEFLIIGDGVVRGANDSMNMVILSDKNVPSFGESKIGLGRISGLRQKLSLFSNFSDVTVTANESDRGEISSLDIVSGKNKVSYRCTATALIKAPKKINDEYKYFVSMSQDELKFIQGGIKAMGAKLVQLIIKKGGEVTISAADAADMFTTTLDSHVECDGDFDTQVINYNADIFLSVLRATTDNVAFSVGEGGSICAIISDHTVYIMPTINNDED